MSNESSNIQSLLNLVEEINKRYVSVRKAKEENGSSYNIFDVLGLTNDEVGLHSTFLASLLSVDKHGAGRKFLDAFLRMPALNLPEGFLDINKVSVQREMYIGPVTDSTGGRIDLFISDGINCIIIENKIYAADQRHQLLRYRNFKPNGKLVYLSLYPGTMPSKDSLGGILPESVTCISYEKDIQQWLNECVQIAANLPYIRETINQYIKTIKQLTGTDMETNSEIIDILSKEENLSAAFAVRDNLNGAINKVINSFLSDLKSGIKESGLPFVCVTEEKDWFQSYVGFVFKNPEWKNICLATEFENVGLRNMAIGFLKHEDVEDIQKLEDVAKLAQGLGYTKHTKAWFWGYPSEAKYYNWNNAESLKMLKDGRMLEWFINTLKNVSELSKSLSL